MSEPSDVIEAEVRDVTAKDRLEKDEPERGTALVPTEQAATLMPVMSVQQAVVRYRQMVEFVQELMTPDLDYGTIPGTAKPTLYKPGAEKLSRFFGLAVKFELAENIEQWEPDDPLFFYRYRCVLTRNGAFVADGFGSCNSREDRYAWRWVDEHMIPAQFDRTTLLSRETMLAEYRFAIEQAETTGAYGKPESYWQMWAEAIHTGQAKPTLKKTRKGDMLDAYEISGKQYRIPNPEVFTLVNTFDKMGQKRSMIAAVLVGVNASEFFTQDVEDIGADALGDEWHPERQQHAPLDEDVTQAKPAPAQKPLPTQPPKPITPKSIKIPPMPTEEIPHEPRDQEHSATQPSKRAEKTRARSWSASHVKELVAQGLAENAANAVMLLNLSPFGAKEPLENVMRWAGIYRARRNEGLKPEVAAETAAEEYRTSS